jgi:tRNA dimethylallyltransferase
MNKDSRQLWGANCPLITIVGETASGKSALAIELARHFNGEIICADSRTVYKGMDIGTAKPSTADRAEIKHYGLDVVRPDQKFTAADFKQLANNAIKDITNRGKLPIMVGGTGLYVDAVLYDYDFKPLSQERDPLNARHLVKPDTPTEKIMRSNTLLIGFQIPLETLRIRIESRIQAMLDAGLQDEVRGLVAQYGWEAPALTGVGYREWHGYFDGTETVQVAHQNIMSGTLKLAKKQRTWFRPSRYQNSPASGPHFLAKTNSSSLDVPEGTSQSPESALAQKLSNQNQTNYESESVRRNNSIQWLNDPSESVEIVTTFLNKIQ